MHLANGYVNIVPSLELGSLETQYQDHTGLFPAKWVQHTLPAVSHKPHELRAAIPQEFSKVSFPHAPKIT